MMAEGYGAVRSAGITEAPLYQTMDEHTEESASPPAQRFVSESTCTTPGLSLPPYQPDWGRTQTSNGSLDLPSPIIPRSIQSLRL